MTENFSIKVAAIEYVISAEYDEANRTLKVMKNGELVSERPVKMRLNSFFTSVVLDGENVVFVCLERSFDGFFNKLFKRSPAFKLDLFVDGVSVKDSSPITRAKDKATELIEKLEGFKYEIEDIAERARDFGAFSMKYAFFAPLLIASIPSCPVPPNTSRTHAPGISN